MDKEIECFIKYIADISTQHAEASYRLQELKKESRRLLTDRKISYACGHCPPKPQKRGPGRPKGSKNKPKVTA